MFCSKCGKEIEEGYRFCPNCGEPIKKFEDASNISREHIPLNWDTTDFKAEKTEVKETTFDWGTETFRAEKRETPNGLMFQDRELVERATAELDLGDVRKRAQGLREDFEKMKETEEPHTELQGFSSAVEDMNNSGFKSIKDIEEELFNSYVEEENIAHEEARENVIEERMDEEVESVVRHEEIVEDTIEEKKSEEVIEESVEEVTGPEEIEITDDVNEDTPEIKKEEFGEEDSSVNRTMPIMEEITENAIEDKLDEVIEEPSETFEEESIDFKREYSDEERASIDDYLEKTIIYNRGDIEKRIEEDRLRIEEEKRREEASKNDNMFIEASLDEMLVTKNEIKEEEPASEVSLDEMLVSENEIKEEEPISAASFDEMPAYENEIKEEELVNEVSLDEMPAYENEVKEEEPVNEVSFKESERLDENFETFHEKNDAFEALLSKEKEKLEEKSEIEDKEVDVSDIEKLFEEKYPEKKKKHGLFHKDDDYTQSVEVLEAIAAALNDNEKNDYYETENSEPVKEEVKEEIKEDSKEKLSRMTITGLNLDSTYDFDNNRELGKVPKEVINEELDGSKVDELKDVIDDYYADKEEEKVKKHTFAKVLIGILVFLIVVEIAIVALKFFAPESSIVAFIDTFTEKAINFVKNLLNRG